MNDKEIKNIGIIGAGKMGTDIFNFLFDFDFKLKFICRNLEKQNILKKKIKRKINRLLKFSLIKKKNIMKNY